MKYDHFEISDDILSVNNKEIKNREKDHNFRMWLTEDFDLLKKCPVCKVALIVEKQYENHDDETYDYATVKVCPNCYYWQCYGDEHAGQGSYGCPTNDINGGISKIMEYEEDIPMACKEELAIRIRREPTLLNHIAPRNLETLIADIYRANYKDSEVIHVGGPADGGVDVVFVDSEDKKWLIQVKRRGKLGTGEGVGTLRNLLGAMALNETKYGIIVSTADHFTYRAEEAADTARTLGFRINLVDKGKLVRMVEPFMPNNPWMFFLDLHLPRWKHQLEGLLPHYVQHELF